MSNETAIATREAPSSALVTREYLNDKAALVRELYAPGTSDMEFEHFIETCATRGLNPLAKQIYCVMRKQKDQVSGKWVMKPTIQTSIDGYRLIAQRTGEYRGQVGPHWCGSDGVWREVWLDEAPPAAARVGVIRQGFSEPLYGVARWSSYVQTTNDGQTTKFWRAMPDVMLAKVAESLALRKAFPEELSGLYTSEEMAQANTPAAAPDLRATRWARLRESGHPDEEIVRRLREVGIESSEELLDDTAWQVAQEAMNEAPVEGEVVTPDADADAAWEEAMGKASPEHNDPVDAQ